MIDNAFKYTDLMDLFESSSKEARSVGRGTLAIVRSSKAIVVVEESCCKRVQAQFVKRAKQRGKLAEE